MEWWNNGPRRNTPILGRPNAQLEIEKLMKRAIPFALTALLLTLSFAAQAQQPMKFTT